MRQGTISIIVCDPCTPGMRVAHSVCERVSTIVFSLAA